MINGTIPLGGTIAPTSTADIYGTHLSLFGIGGSVEVATNTERDAIPVGTTMNAEDPLGLSSGRRRLGMKVTVADGYITYTLGKATKTEWDALDDAGKVSHLNDPTNWVTPIRANTFTNIADGASSPASPILGDTIYSEADETLYLYIKAGTQSIWYDISSVGNGVPRPESKIANFEIVQGGNYFVDTSNGSIDATLAAGVVSFSVADFNDTWTDANELKITIGADSFIFNLNDAGKKFDIFKDGSTFRVYSSLGEFITLGNI